MEKFACNASSSLRCCSKCDSLKQVKCEVIVKKNFTGCERCEIWSSAFRTSLHMTLPEPQRGEDPTPEKYICIMDLSLLGQIIKSKIKLKLKISV